MEVYTPASATFQSEGAIRASFQPDQVTATFVADGTFVGKASNVPSVPNVVYSGAVNAEFERSNQLLIDARQKEFKKEDRYSYIAEAFRLLVLAAFGLFLNLSITFIGYPIHFVYVRFVRFTNFFCVFREWLQVPVLPRLLGLISGTISRVYNFAVWVVETVLRRPGLVNNTQSYISGVWTRSLQQRAKYEAYYTAKRQEFFAAISKKKVELVNKKNETVQRLNEKTTTAIDTTKKEAYVLLNKSHQLVHERKNIPVGRYASEIAQLAVVILLHTVALVTNLAAYPVIMLSQRVSSYRRTPEVVTISTTVLKKTE